MFNSPAIPIYVPSVLKPVRQKIDLPIKEV